MPKSTFYNLNIEKKEKIKKALKKEFTKNTFEKASISNIIEEAQIPRGSFYQYFEDKEDALKYIIEEFLDNERKQTKELLIKNNGDIFLTTLDLYTYLVYRNYNKTEIKLFQNIMNALKSDNVNIFKNIELKNFRCLKNNQDTNGYINTDLLNIENNDDIEYILRILTCVLRAEVMDVMHEKISGEEGKRALIRQIEILKKGMTK